MSTITPAKPARATDPVDGNRMTVDQYERLGELDDPRVELVDGYLVKKMPKGPSHIWSVRALIRTVARHLPAGWFQGKEDPIRIPDYDEPEPDVSIIQGTEDDYRDRIAEGGDIALVIEVSDTTLSQDRGKKRLAYAKAKIPVYWIVNLVNRWVEVYGDPGPDGYQSHEVFKPGQDIPIVIGGQQVGSIAVDDILPLKTEGNGT
jgi:Uma2 family endonuclease